MKKIVHVIPSLSKSSGGPAHAIWQMIDSIKDVSEMVILSTKEGLSEVEISELLELQNPKVFLFDYRGKHSYKTSFSLFKKANSFMNAVHAFHIHAGFSLISEWVALKCIFYKQHFVYRPLGTFSAFSLESGNTLIKRVFLPIEKLILEQSRFVHATSVSEKKAILKICPKSDVKLIPPTFINITNTIKSERFKEPNQLHIGFISRIHPKKNLEFLFSSLSQCENKNWKLSIAGDGDKEYINSLQNCSKNFGIDKNIEWLGFLNSIEKKSFFNTIDWFVLPSLHENFGISVLEALNHGVPCLVSNQVEIVDWFNQKDDESFLKTLNLNEKKWAQYLDKIAEESQENYMLRTQNLAHILQTTFAKDYLKKSLIELYQI
jgi:glycosyltransferase involved in cell wall biosynthesis